MYKMNYELMQLLYQNRQYPPFRYSKILWASMFRDSQPENQVYYDHNRASYKVYSAQLFASYRVNYFDDTLKLGLSRIAPTAKEAYRLINADLRKLYNPKYP